MESPKSRTYTGRAVNVGDPSEKIDESLSTLLSKGTFSLRRTVTNAMNTNRID